MSLLPFRPPQVRASPDLHWLLLRSFGPVGSPAPAGFDGVGSERIARQFHLRERIAARIEPARLLSELGPELSKSFQDSLRRSGVETMRLSALARGVAEIAATRGIPLVFLKFAALDALNAVTPGSRPAADVDILVPASRVRELQDAIEASGLVPGAYKPCDHHLVALRSRRGGCVELHYRLPGVRFRGTHSVGADDILSSGRVVRLSQFPGECFAPSADLHAAYLIVHGFVQHGPFPRTYSLLRVLCDLIDLEAASGRLRSDEICGLVRRELKRRDVAAVAHLCYRLQTGDESLIRDLSGDGAAGETALLRHILARTLSPGYQEKLSLQTLLPMSDAPRALVFARSAFKKLVPTDSHLDRVYGPRTSRLGYLARRLNRPLDLLFRLGRSLGGSRMDRGNSIPSGLEKRDGIGEDIVHLNKKKGVAS